MNTARVASVGDSTIPLLMHIHLRDNVMWFTGVRKLAIQNERAGQALLHCMLEHGWGEKALRVG